MKTPPGNVVELDGRRGATTWLTCTCGSVWWNTAVVVEDGAVASHAQLVCRACGVSAP